MPPATLFAFGYDKYRSFDLGKTWQDSITSAFGTFPAFGIVNDPENFHHLLANIYPGIVESVDSGKTWHPVTSGNYQGIWFDPIHSNIVYYSGGTIENQIFQM